MGAAEERSVSMVVDESLDEQDRSEIYTIIVNLRKSYTDRLSEAALEFHRAQRAVNRASHEITRLERHIERIDGFIEKHSITMEEE